MCSLPRLAGDCFDPLLVAKTSPVVDFWKLLDLFLSLKTQLNVKQSCLAPTLVSDLGDGAVNGVSMPPSV